MLVRRVISVSVSFHWYRSRQLQTSVAEADRRRSTMGAHRWRWYASPTTTSHVTVEIENSSWRECVCVFNGHGWYGVDIWWFTRCWRCLRFGMRNACVRSPHAAAVPTYLCHRRPVRAPWVRAGNRRRRFPTCRDAFRVDRWTTGRCEIWLLGVLQESSAQRPQVIQPCAGSTYCTHLSCIRPHTIDCSRRLDGHNHVDHVLNGIADEFDLTHYMTAFVTPPGGDKARYSTLGAVYAHELGLFHFSSVHS